MFAIDEDKPADPAKMPDAERVDPDGKVDDGVDHRHKVLIECLRDESELQAEERTQMAIDNDYQDHLHWRPEDAEVLMGRGQAPLVFNEGRLSIEWMCGMQKRMRLDYNILPREESDQPAAEAKTKVFKYVSDANLAPWHTSFAYRQAVISGLGWLEEGINTDPGAEQIYTGSEDWRNVFRDSRNRHFDINEDSRYLFRKKRVDLDYAQAILPKAKTYLRGQAMRPEEDDRTADQLWYLGERLTGATDLVNYNGSLSDRYRDRSAYIGGWNRNDIGRRLSVDLIEAWYRVFESIQVFGTGPLKGKEFNPRDAGHVQLQTDRWRIYQAVAKRMRVMICTENAPLWDGKSPFRHNKFLLVPVWGSRRGRDGQPYGLWRGMRDINDDINKRASKALHAASSNRVTVKKGAVADVEIARSEAARPDAFIEVKDSIDNIRYEKPALDMEMNMQLLQFDRDMLRNSGGVTNDNLGRDSNVISGKAVGLKQDQGSLVTSEFPDNLRLAMQIAGKIRLSNIEQFMTEQQVIRITGDGAPPQWLSINEPQADGTMLNDIANSEADFIISAQNYRESFAQAAMESMMELLSQVAAFNPQLVTAVLDLVVESSEVINKDEWVARIRSINGQRDPKKPPTPQELEQQAKDKAMADEQKEMAQEQMRLSLEELRAKIDKLGADTSKLDTQAILTRVESMFSALQAAQIVAMTPTVAPVADTIMQGAGFVDQNGQDPNLPQPAVQVLPPQAVADAPLGTVAPAEGIQPAPESALAAMPSADASVTPGEGEASGIQTPTGADNAP